MFYSVDLTIPANTSPAAPAVLDVQLLPCTVQQVDVQFPAGCAGLVHSVARRGAHQLWPSNPDANLAADGVVISWQEDFDIDDAPFGVRLAGWNLDDTYAHTVTWRFACRSLSLSAAEPILRAVLATLEVNP